MSRITLLLFLCLSQTLNSQTINWDGGGNGLNWADAENWEMDVLPGVGDEVIIDADSVVIEHVDPPIKNLLLINDAKLVNFATLTFSGSFGYAIRADSSSIINHAKIVVEDVGNNELSDWAVELLNDSHFYNTNTSALLDIQQTNGLGISVGGGSTIENDGSILIVSLYGPGISMGGNGNFTNRNLIDIRNQGIFPYAISLGGVATFTNSGNITIDVSGFLGTGLKISAGGIFVNEGTITIDAANQSRGIDSGGNYSLIHHKDGNIQINLSSASGIRLFRGELKIDPGAIIEVNNPCDDFYVQIDSAAIFDCQGILDVGN